MSAKILVAGVGNIFLGDDGFGVAVARQLAGESLPEGVAVEDFGIRGVHLAYQLLDGYDALRLIGGVRRRAARPRPPSTCPRPPSTPCRPPRPPAPMAGSHRPCPAWSSSSAGASI